MALASMDSYATGRSTDLDDPRRKHEPTTHLPAVAAAAALSLTAVTPQSATQRAAFPEQRYASTCPRSCTPFVTT